MKINITEASINPALWEQPEMRTALGARDIGAVYRLLQRSGVTQSRIAAMTGQSQPEVSEILSGRQVISYDLLSRIADGLGAPRGRLGLACHDADVRCPSTLTAPGGRDSRR